MTYLRIIKTIAGTVAFTVIVAAPSAAQDVSFSAEDRGVGEAVLQTAARYFASVARDKGSLTFRNVYLAKRSRPTNDSKIVVCGEVNGRNGYGGNTGFQAFIASGKDVYVGKVAGFSVQETCLRERVFDGRDYAPELKAGVEGQ